MSSGTQTKEREGALEENLRKEELRTSPCDEPRRPPEKGEREKAEGEEVLCLELRTAPLTCRKELVLCEIGEFLFFKEAFLFPENEKGGRVSSISPLGYHSHRAGLSRARP